MNEETKQERVESVQELKQVQWVWSSEHKEDQKGAGAAGWAKDQSLKDLEITFNCPFPSKGNKSISYQNEYERKLRKDKRQGDTLNIVLTLRLENKLLVVLYFLCILICLVKKNQC